MSDTSYEQKVIQRELQQVLTPEYEVINNNFYVVVKGPCGENCTPGGIINHLEISVMREDDGKIKYSLFPNWRPMRMSTNNSLLMTIKTAKRHIEKMKQRGLIKK